MNRILSFLLALGLFVPFLAAPSVVRADSTYFCKATVRVAPTDKSTDYKVMLLSKAASVNARVTLISDVDAWSVLVPDSQTHTVHFAAPVNLKYAFVDGVATAGEQTQNDCPSVVTDVSASNVTGASAYPVLTPTFLQKLPALTCGSTYTPITMTHEDKGAMGDYGKHHFIAQVEVDVDSEGHIGHVELSKPSGSEGIDATALANAQHSTYAPAKFLCAAVVGTYTYTLDYNP